LLDNATAAFAPRGPPELPDALNEGRALVIAGAISFEVTK